jgi:hypothetical protein
MTDDMMTVVAREFMDNLQREVEAKDKEIEDLSRIIGAIVDSQGGIIHVSERSRIFDYELTTWKVMDTFELAIQAKRIEP